MFFKLLTWHNLLGLLILAGLCTVCIKLYIKARDDEEMAFQDFLKKLFIIASLGVTLIWLI